MSYEYQTILIALGANTTVDNRSCISTLQSAVRLLTLCANRDFSCSNLYRSPAFPVGSGPDYVNAASRFQSAVPPHELIARLHSIEEELGRARSKRWGPRVIDLDLLAVGDRVCPDLEEYARWRDLPPQAQLRDTPQDLILPHPRLQDRAFVLKPLAEIAPDWCHPVSGMTVRAMLDACPADQRDAVQLIAK